MSVEEWRPIPGWEGMYEVSDQGRVKSLHRRSTNGRILSARYNSHGYAQLNLSGKGLHVTAKVHTLVLLAFIGPRPDGQVACHFDDDKTNNHLSNLRYDTLSANVSDAIRNGVHPAASKTRCKHGHALSGENLSLRTTASGRVHRVCKSCRNRLEVERRDRRNATRREARRLKAGRTVPAEQAA